MSEPKSIRKKSLEQIVDQQMRLNNAISKETYDIVKKYQSGEEMSDEDMERLRTLGSRGVRVTSAYINMVNNRR